MSIQVAAPLFAAGITAGAKLSNGELPKLRIGFAGVFAAVSLSALSNVAPAITRAFAILIILGALLGPGYDLVRALTRLIT